MSVAYDAGVVDEALQEIADTLRGMKVETSHRASTPLVEVRAPDGTLLTVMLKEHQREGTIL